MGFVLPRQCAYCNLEPPVRQHEVLPKKIHNKQIVCYSCAQTTVLVFFTPYVYINRAAVSYSPETQTLMKKLLLKNPGFTSIGSPVRLTSGFQLLGFKGGIFLQKFLWEVLC